ncbi:MAG: adenylate/guanylate cyclase domain-containing protein [Anaerolineae bacterium]|nr:MAG: adenylate/guanylate cyclase domain-containing protein [Anaerolineae bacterium]
MLLNNQSLTFLFTDIEGSASLWEQHADVMPAILAEHDALLQATVTDHGGQVVKRTGDGIMAVFDAQASGVSAAAEAQRRLLSNGESLDIKVRMGLHFGTAVPRDGDFYGTEVNRAARLMALASGGQVLLSEECVAVLNPPPASCQFLDLGKYYLKGFMEPRRVYQLIADGLPHQFPPLAGGVETPHNLPEQLASFVGRDKQVNDLLNMFQQIAAPASGAIQERMVTLIGPGGTGKTRLSLELGARLLPDFPDGAWLIELAPLREPSQIPYIIGNVFGLQEMSAMPIEELIVSYLRQRRALIILDNCEHMVEASADMAETLLQGCSHLALLASSREALGVPGERVYRVPSLSLPAEGESDPQRVQSSEAARLLVDRGRSANHSFALTAGNAGAISQICRRLDGIPLALELAAVRLRAMTAEQVADRLDDRFRLLTGGSRTALPRQQTLHALIDWSYELLDEDEKSLLRRLSVFVGGWTLEAAEAVSPDLNVLDLLPQLVDKSLVMLDEDALQPRYRLLETIRQFARDQLTKLGEAPPARDNHLAYYHDLAVTASQSMLSDEQVEWYELTEREYENYRAAMDWSQERQPLLFVELAAAIGFFWSRIGFQECNTWIRAALDASKSITVEDPSRLHRARATALDNLASESLGHIPADAVIALAREALVEAEASQDLLTVGYAHGITAFISLQSGDFATAEEMSAIASEMASRGDYLLPRILLQMIRSGIHIFQGQNLEKARAELDIAVQLIGQRKLPYIAGILYLNLIQLEQIAGNLEKSLEYAKTGHQVVSLIKDRSMTNIMMAEMGHCYRKMGNLQEALNTYSQTIRIFADLGQLPAVAHQLESYAFIAIFQNQTERAAALFGAAETLRAGNRSAMTPVEAAEYSRNLEQLKTMLPESELNDAWARGAAMNMDEAVQFACTAAP